MNTWLGGLAAGLLLLNFLPGLPPWPWCLASAGLLLLVSLRFSRLLPVAAFAFGLTWSVYQAGQALDARLPHAWEGQKLLVTGTIADLPESSGEDGVRFHLQPQCVELEGRSHCELPDSLWQLSSQDGLPVRPGETWRLLVSAKRPHTLASPGAFDSEGWDLEEGIGATGYVRSGERLKPSPWWSMDDFRLRIRERFQQAFGSQPEAGVQLALLTGDRSLVPPGLWNLYLRTGITHLMAISGPHITLAGLVVAFLLRRALRQRPGFATRVALPDICLFAAFVVSIAYGFLAGLGIPTERTLLMLAVAVWATWRRRELPAFAVLLRALVIVLLFQPLAVQAAGFWLSFGAVALLMLLAWSVPGEAAWREFGRTQGIVTIGLLPLTVAIFARVSLVSPLANVVAIPLVTFVVVPIGMLGLLADAIWHPAGHFVWQLGIWCVEGLDWGLGYMATWSWASVSWSLPPLALACFALAAACLLLPRGVPGRWLAPFFLVPVVWSHPPLPEGTWRFTLLDVGQGLSAVVQTRNHVLVYDTGPSFGPNADAGGRIVLPYLHWAGINRVDTLMLSHDDLDHTGGAVSVFNGITVGQELGAWPERVQGVQAVHQPCQAGQQWQWDGVTFSVLYPWPGLTLKGTNNTSCVLKVEGAGHTLLLPGDLEKQGEAELVAHYSQRLPSEVLVLGHHGSASSSSPAFLAAVAPKVALVSAGYRNRFHHPSGKVIDRLGDMHLAWLSTVDSGALIYDFRAGSPGLPTPLEWRRTAAHYWLSSP